MLNEAISGFRTPTTESIHGSLLVFEALFDYGEMVCSLPISTEVTTLGPI